MTAKTAKEFFNQPNPPIEKWRTEKKGDTIEKGGKTYYWCNEHHHSKGFYHGLYVTSHKQCDHQAWLKNGKRKINYGPPNPPSAPSGSGDNNSDSTKMPKLGLNARLREVLCSRYMMSDEDVDDICKNVGQEN